MDVTETYLQALDLFNAEKYDAALKIVDDMKPFELEWKKPLLLKAYILCEQERFIDLFNFAEKILPLFDPSSPEEKEWQSTALDFLGVTCSKLAMPEVAVELLRLSGELSKNNAEVCVELSSAILTANASEKFSREDFQKLYDEYKSYLSDIMPFASKVYEHKKIRVGFMSADFYLHPVINWSFPLLTKLDKNFFATYLYSSNKDSDVVTEFLRSTVLWRDISDLTDVQAAQLIRDDEIDILFNLSGHTSKNRLRVAAFRPATVQISGIGYMNSTGIDCFDYFLSDVYCAGDETYFTEKLIRLPHTHICYAPSFERKILSAPCTRNGFVTFGTFNRFAKFTDTILAAWKEILDRVPKSRLLLKQKLFNREDERNFVGGRLKSLGFDLERVDMRGYSENYLDDYNDVDIALDTFPYTGGVTTCEALWMGVPVVSLFGDRHGTRFGLSMLTNVGLEELAVPTVDEYISRAVMLANDRELLTLLRRNLRDMMKKSPLMDEASYVREVEKVFKQILDLRR